MLVLVVVVVVVGSQRRVARSLCIINRVSTRKVEVRVVFVVVLVVVAIEAVVVCRYVGR